MNGSWQFWHFSCLWNKSLGWPGIFCALKFVRRQADQNSAEQVSDGGDTDTAPASVRADWQSGFWVPCAVHSLILWTILTWTLKIDGILQSAAKGSETLVIWPRLPWLWYTGPSSGVCCATQRSSGQWSENNRIIESREYVDLDGRFPHISSPEAEVSGTLHLSSSDMTMRI